MCAVVVEILECISCEIQFSFDCVDLVPMFVRPDWSVPIEHEQRIIVPTLIRCPRTRLGLQCDE